MKTVPSRRARRARSSADVVQKGTSSPNKNFVTVTISRDWLEAIAETELDALLNHTLSQPEDPADAYREALEYNAGTDYEPLVRKFARNYRTTARLLGLDLQLPEPGGYLRKIRQQQRRAGA